MNTTTGQPSAAAWSAPSAAEMSVRFDGRVGPVDMLILAVLGEHWMHGYALIDKLSSHSDGQLDLPQGTVYPALHRLTSAGHLQRRTELVDGRRRLYYRRSPRGQRHFVRRHQQWRAMTSIVDAVLDSVSTQSPPT